jgi:transposase-like protein
LRWVQCFVPAFEIMWKKYARPVGLSWRVDETYIKVKGQWRYLYRAVDKQGQTVDFLLSENRDQAAAVRFFKKAIGNHDVPEKITLDGSRASHQAVAELKAKGILPAQTLVRTNKKGSRRAMNRKRLRGSSMNICDDLHPPERGMRRINA